MTDEEQQADRESDEDEGESRCDRISKTLNMMDYRHIMLLLLSDSQSVRSQLMHAGKEEQKSAVLINLLI